MKLNKKQIRPLIVFAVVFIVYQILAFMLPFVHTGVFWVGYVFGMIAIIVSALIFVLAFGKDDTAKSRFYGFPIERVGLIYFCIQIAFSFLTMALAWIVILPIWPFALVSILLLAAAVLGTVATDITRDEIERQDVQLKKDVSAMRELRSLGNSLVAQCQDADAKTELKSLADMLDYSDPVSNDATVALEAELKTALEEIQQALVENDSESIVPLCKKAEAMLAERNRLCKLNK